MCDKDTDIYESLKRTSLFIFPCLGYSEMLYHSPHMSVTGTVRNGEARNVVYAAAAVGGEVFKRRWVESSKGAVVRKDRQGCSKGTEGCRETCRV